MLTSLDPDEFLAWKAHPITRHVLESFAMMGEQVRDETMRHFFEADGFIYGPDRWRIDYNRGAFDAYQTVTSITLDEIERVYAESSE